MLAGLPKAPSAYNPVTNPKRAKTRQLYVLRRMHDLRYITDEQFREAQTAPLAVRQGLRDAIPIACGVRRRNGPADGLRRLRGGRLHARASPSTRPSARADQEAAYAAVRRGVIEYDHRHGYRGPEAFASLPDDAGRARSRAGAAVPGRERKRRPGPRRRHRSDAAPGQGGARATAKPRRSAATGSSSPPARSATRLRRRRASARAR